MKIVLFESQLKKLIEGYAFDNYGFINASYDEREPNYDVLASIDVFSLVKKKNSKETYIVYVDDVPYDYHEGDFEYVNDDEDEDHDSDTFWDNAYREFQDDTHLSDSGIAFFAEDLIQDAANITTSVDEITNPGDKYILLITPENKAEVYTEFEDLIQAYLDPSEDEITKNKPNP